MSRGPITPCPICQQDVGMDARTQQEASELLAQHIFREHTKHKKGQQAVLQIPVEAASHLTQEEKQAIETYGHLKPSRSERRRQFKRMRGNSQGRPAR